MRRKIKTVGDTIIEMKERLSPVAIKEEVGILSISFAN